jgi:hypothetical protein
MVGADPSVVDQGQLSLAEAAALITGIPSVGVRLAVERRPEKVHVLRMELTGPLEIARFESLSWDYGGFLFRSLEADGSTVGRWLKDGLVQIDDLTAGLSASEQTSWERLPSHADRDRPSLPWPQLLQARFSPAGGVLQPSYRPRLLVAPGAPTFPSYEVASEAFFYGLRSLAPPQTYNDVVVLRLVDRRARLTRVIFSAAGVDVHAEGSDVVGCRVEITSNVGHHETAMGSEGIARIDLPAGVPAEWWLVLSRGNTWLDYRYNGAYGRGPAPSVEVLADAVEPADELAALMGGGESLTLELKRELPADREGRRRAARTVAAFANGVGGVILFGVDRDEFTIVGLEGEFPKLRDELNTFVTELLTPRADVDIRPYEVDGKLVIGLHVKQGQNSLYGVGPGDPRYYIRRSGSTVPARPEDVSLLVSSRSRSQQPEAWPGLRLPF